MSIRSFSKQERRGLIGIFVLLLLIICIVIWQDRKETLSNSVLYEESDSFYKKIQLRQEIIDEQYDSLNKVQKKSCDKKRAKSKTHTKYIERNPVNQPISTK